MGHRTPLPKHLQELSGACPALLVLTARAGRLEHWGQRCSPQRGRKRPAGPQLQLWVQRSSSTFSGTSSRASGSRGSLTDAQYAKAVQTPSGPATGTCLRKPRTTYRHTQMAVTVRHKSYTLNTKAAGSALTQPYLQFPRHLTTPGCTCKHSHPSPLLGVGVMGQADHPGSEVDLGRTGGLSRLDTWHPEIGETAKTRRVWSLRVGGVDWGSGCEVGAEARRNVRERLPVPGGPGEQEQ